MSKFNTILENHLSETDLIRIRIKHDPANLPNERRDYVGYILQEDGPGNILAIAPEMGMEPMTVSIDQFDIVNNDCGFANDPLTRFKKFVVNHLLAKGFHDQLKNHMDVLLNAKHVTDLERLVTSCGCEDGTTVLNMYRDYAQNEV